MVWLSSRRRRDGGRGRRRAPLPLPRAPRQRRRGVRHLRARCLAFVASARPPLPAAAPARPGPRRCGPVPLPPPPVFCAVSARAAAANLSSSAAAARLGGAGAVGRAVASCSATAARCSASTARCSAAATRSASAAARAVAASARAVSAAAWAAASGAGAGGFLGFGAGSAGGLLRRAGRRLRRLCPQAQCHFGAAEEAIQRIGRRGEGAAQRRRCALRGEVPAVQPVEQHRRAAGGQCSCGSQAVWLGVGGPARWPPPPPPRAVAGEIRPRQHLGLVALGVDFQEADLWRGVGGADLSQVRQLHLDRVHPWPAAAWRAAMAGSRWTGRCQQCGAAPPARRALPAAQQRVMSRGRAAARRAQASGSARWRCPRQPLAAKRAVTESTSGSPAPTSTQKPSARWPRARCSSTSSACWA